MNMKTAVAPSILWLSDFEYTEVSHLRPPDPQYVYINTPTEGVAFFSETGRQNLQVRISASPNFYFGNI
jgi:hypothetical protein